MADNARPPVAVRIVRPYDTEEEFLESELETVGKTSVILIGAHARPTGVILRFELTLANGQVVLRGEGRVLAHKESAFRGQPGLALRFTRLDPKSKALVDRAGQIREARLSGSMPPQPIPPVPESSSSPLVTASESSSPIVDAKSDSVPPQAPTPPPVESRPPTKPPPQSSSGSERPVASAPLLAAMPSFPPMPPPSNIPMSAPPANPNMTYAPDPMLAQILTAPTPPPPANATKTKSDRPTSRPPPGEIIPDEAKTRPGKRAELAALIDESPSQVPNVHATTTVAAPAIKDERTESADEAQAAPVASEPPPPPPPEPLPVPTKETDTALTRVADRDALLARLRERRAGMSDKDKDDILRSR